MKPVGIAFAEIDLDATKLEQGLAKLNDRLVSGSIKVEDAYKSLGLKSDQVFNMMKANATAAVEFIKNKTLSSLEEIYNAEKAASTKIAAINAQQFAMQRDQYSQRVAMAKSASDAMIADRQLLGVRTTEIINAEKAAIESAYLRQKTAAAGNARDLIVLEEAKNAKMLALNMEIHSARLATMNQEKMATASKVEAQIVMEKAHSAALIENDKRTRSQGLMQIEATKETARLQQEEANKNYATLGIKSAADVKQRISDVTMAATAQQAIVGKSSEDWIRIERAKNEKLKELNKEMVGSHELSVAAMMRAVLRWYAVYYVVSSVFGFIKDRIMDGIKAIDDFKVNTIAVAATITNLQGSNNVAEHYKEAVKYAGLLNLKLMEVDANSFANYQQIQLMNRAMNTHNVFLDTRNKKQIESFTAITNTIALLTTGQNKEIQASQEMNALMTGQIRAQDRVAMMIDGIIKQEGIYRGGLKEVVALGNQHGDTLERLAPYLVGITAASGDIANTWESASSSLETAWGILQREIFKGFYEDLTKSGKELSKWIKDNVEAISDWATRWRINVISVEAEVMRLAMLLDKVGGTMTAAKMLLYGPGAALGIESSTKRFEAAANANIEYEKRYKETDKALEALALKQIGLEQTLTKEYKDRQKLEQDNIKTPKTKGTPDAEALKKTEDIQKQVTEIIRKNQLEREEIGKDTYDKELLRIESEVVKYKEAGWTKTQIDKFTNEETKTAIAKWEEDNLKERVKASEEYQKQMDATEKSIQKGLKETNAEVKKITDDAITAANQRLVTERSLYKDLKDVSGLYYEGEKAVIEDEAKQRLTALINEKTSARDAANYRIAIEAAKQNKLQLLSIEEAKRSDDLFVGYNAGLLEMKRNLYTWGQAGIDIFKDFATQSQTFVSDILFDGMKGKLKNFGDYFKSLWDSLLRTFMNILSKMLVQWALLQSGMAQISATTGLLSIAGTGVAGGLTAGAAQAATTMGVSGTLVSGGGGAAGGAGTYSGMAGTTATGAGYSAGLQGIIGSLKIGAANATLEYAPYLVGKEAGESAGLYIAGMSDSAFAGWSAGITTFVSSMIKGEDIKTATVRAMGVAGTTYAGAAIGSYFGPWGTVIGGAAGAILGSLGMGKLLGKKEHKFTLEEQVKQSVSDLTFNKALGFEKVGYTDPVGGNKWYGPIKEAYAGTIETIQQSFNKMVFDFSDKLPKEMQDQILQTLESTDFGLLQKEASGGRWKLHKAEKAITEIAKKYADALAKTLSDAYANALGDYVATKGAAGLIGDTAAWAVLTNRVQNNINDMFLTIADKIKSGGIEEGLKQINDITTVINNISQAMQPISEIIATEGMSEYALELYNINKQFDAYAKSLEEAGIDLAKYTDLEKARGIVLAKVADQERQALLDQRESIAQWLSDMNRSPLAPSNSMEAVQSEYNRLKDIASTTGATSSDTSNYLNYAKEYLAYMRSYGGDYKEIYAGVMTDVGGLKTGIDLQIDLAQKQLDALKLIEANTAATAAATAITAVTTVVTAAGTTAAGTEAATVTETAAATTINWAKIDLTKVDWSQYQYGDVWTNYLKSLEGKAEGGYADTPEIFGEAGGEWAVPTYEPQRKNFLKSAPKAFWDNLGLNGGSNGPDGGEKVVHIHIHNETDGREVSEIVAKYIPRNGNLSEAIRRAVN